MALLSKKDILAADDIRHEDVPVPEWGGEVRVRGLTGAQRSAIEGTMMAIKGQEVSVRADMLARLRQRLLSEAIVGEDGKPLLTEKEVAGKSGAVLDRLFAIASRLSGMNDEAVETLAGNSGAGPSAGSDSA